MLFMPLTTPDRVLQTETAKALNKAPSQPEID